MLCTLSFPFFLFLSKERLWEKVRFFAHSLFEDGGTLFGGEGRGVRSTQELERRRRKGLHGLLAKQGKEEEEENKGFPHHCRRRIIRPLSIYRHDIMWGIPSCVFLRRGKGGQMLAERVRLQGRSSVPFTDDNFPRKRNTLDST